MRRSGSSSCMLRPKSQVLGPDQQQHGDKMSVTLINKQPLPAYSTERFYMLSELKLHSHSTTFLCDHQDDETQDTVESSEVGSMDGIIHMQQSVVQQPSYNVLYVLWRPDQVMSELAFAKGPLAAAVQQWKTVVASEDSAGTNQEFVAEETGQHLYIVVDIIEPFDTAGDINDDKDVKQRKHEAKMDMAERLARHVAQSPLFRSAVDGITIGVSNHIRAAPGLEACLDAVVVGSRDRRRCSSDAKSFIGMVALHPDDLLGLQNESVTDAAQGVLQSRICAEWNGNGNLQSFARRAHSEWCVSHGVDEEPTSPPRKPKARRRGRRDIDEDFGIPMVPFLLLFFFGFVLSHLWINYYAENQ